MALIPPFTGGAARSEASCREVEQNDHLHAPPPFSNVVPASNAVSSISCRKSLANAIGVVVRSVGAGRIVGAELMGKAARPKRRDYFAD